MSLHILVKAALFPWRGAGRWWRRRRRRRRRRRVNSFIGKEGGMGGWGMSGELIDWLESFYFMLEREHRRVKTSHVVVHKKVG